MIVWRSAILFVKNLLPLLGPFAWVMVCVVCVTGQEGLSSGNDGDSARMEYGVISSIIERYKYDPKRLLVFDESLKPCSAPIRLGATDLGLSQLELEAIYNDCALKESAKVDAAQLRQATRPIKKTDYQSFFEKRDCEMGWKAFNKRYPNSQGYVGFSRVGFDKDKNFALVEFAYVKECLNGEGHQFLVRRSSDGWKVVKEASLWMF